MKVDLHSSSFAEQSHASDLINCFAAQMPEIGRCKLFITLKYFDIAGVLSTMQYRNLSKFFLLHQIHSLYNPFIIQIFRKEGNLDEIDY